MKPVQSVGRAHGPDSGAALLTIPKRLSLSDVTLERVIPRHIILPLCQILFVFNLKPDLDQRLTSVIVPPHLGDPITEFNLVCDLSVFGVRGVVTVGHDPFVDTKDTTGFENLEDLAVDALKGRSVAGGLDGVDWRGRTRKVDHQHTVARSPSTQEQTLALTSVKRVLPKLLAELHEIPLFEIEQMTQPSLGRVFSSTGQLEIVVIDTGNVGVGETGDLSSGTSDTTPDVEDFHSLFDTDLSSEVVFMSSELCERENE